MNYADLQVTTHFSFLRGVSSAEELFSAAAVLGIKALGIVDRNSLARFVGAHHATLSARRSRAPAKDRQRGGPSGSAGRR